jgi:hypothetical protein
VTQYELVVGDLLGPYVRSQLADLEAEPCPAGCCLVVECADEAAAVDLLGRVLESPLDVDRIRALPD